MEMKVPSGAGTTLVNDYSTAPTKEKVWTTLGPEFGNDNGNQSLVACDLYSLKSAGAGFCSHLGCCMQGIGYKPVFLNITYVKRQR